QISDEKFYDAKFEVDIAKAELKGDHEEAARIRLRKAEAGFERLQKRHAEKLASSEALEEARLNVELQRAALKGDDLGFAQIQEQLRQSADHSSEEHNHAASSGQKSGAGKIAKDVLQAEIDPKSWGMAVRGVQ